MGLIRLRPRPGASSPAPARQLEHEPEEDRAAEPIALSEPAADPAPPALTPVPVAVRRRGGPRFESRHRARPERNAGDRAREPEGRCREDDDDAEPRGRVRRDGPSRAARRSRPAGQPHDEPGAQPGRDRAVDVRRTRPEAPDLGGDRAPRGRPRRRVDRPRRRRAGAQLADRTRAGARQGAASRCGTPTTSCSSTRHHRSGC